MDVIKFKQCNTIYAKDQPEYNPLVAYKTDDGAVTSCWKLNIRERVRVLLTGKIFLQVLTFNSPLQPVKMLVDNPIKEVSNAEDSINT